MAARGGASTRGPCRRVLVEFRCSFSRGSLASAGLDLLPVGLEHTRAGARQGSMTMVNGTRWRLWPKPLGVDLALMGRVALALMGGAVIGSAASTAHAEEPLRVTEPHVLRQPAEVVDVIDAFDDGDAFDLTLSLGFQQSWKSSRITRETSITQAGLSSGDYTASTLNVAQYSEATTRLLTRADIGVFKDVALFMRLPIIISNDRKLEGVDGSETRQGVALQGYPGETLFRLPFSSPTRSGIEYFAVGLDVNLMNQWRDSTKPTWLFGVEGRFNVSEPMHACNDAPASGRVSCADPGDLNQNGVAGESSLEADNFTGRRNAGVSRGTTGLAFHTIMSKRIKYIEPYAGITGLFEFQNENSDFGKTDIEGALVNHPPFEGTLLMGLAVMPWEELDEFRRLELDFRFAGTYRSEGRDYTELFDALGSSPAASMREPRYSKYKANSGSNADTVPSVVDEQSTKIYMTGITDVQPYGLYTLSTQATWMVNKLLKFNLGLGYTFVQGHLLTYDQPCNPNLKRELGDAGPCRNVGDTSASGFSVTGIPNANYREVINTPGRRFRVDSSDMVDLWLSAALMF